MLFCCANTIYGTLQFTRVTQPQIEKMRTSVEIQKEYFVMEAWVTLTDPFIAAAPSYPSPIIFLESSPNLRKQAKTEFDTHPPFHVLNEQILKRFTV